MRYREDRRKRAARERAQDNRSRRAKLVPVHMFPPPRLRASACILMTPDFQPLLNARSKGHSRFRRHGRADAAVGRREPGNLVLRCEGFGLWRAAHSPAQSRRRAARARARRQFRAARNRSDRHRGGARDGVAAPRVRYVLKPEDEAGIGYVMDRLPGETIARKILRDADFDAVRPRFGTPMRRNSRTHPRRRYCAAQRHARRRRRSRAIAPLSRHLRSLQLSPSHVRAGVPMARTAHGASRATDARAWRFPPRQSADLAQRRRSRARLGAHAYRRSA